MKEKSSAKLYLWLAILAAGTLVGLYAFYQILAYGHGETLGVNDQVPWGLFLAAFAFLIGASAGSTIIGLLIHAFGRDEYRPLGVPAMLVGLLSLMAAMAFIALDVGNFGRMLLVPWALRNSSSMFFYTSSTYYVFGLILLAGLYFSVKALSGRASASDKRVSRWLAIAAFPVALWVLHAEGALFGVVKAREYWNTPLLPVHFAVAALVTGTAVMILAAVTGSFAGKRLVVSRQTLDHMGKLLVGFVLVTLLFDIVDIAVTNYSDTPEGSQAWALLTGKYSGLYLVNIGGLVLSAAILLFRGGRQTGGLVLASSIAILATAAYRYNLVVVGQSVPLWEGQAGLTVGYAPSSVEVGITVGVVSAALLAYTLLTRALSSEDTGAKESQPDREDRLLVPTAS